MSAILEDKYAYLISEHAEATHDALIGDELYVIDTCEEGGKEWLEVRRMDLNTGGIKASWKGRLRNNVYNSRIVIQDDVVVVRGACGSVLDRCTLEERFSEDNMHNDDWEPGGFSFIYNDLYYRCREALQKVGGVDVVNTATQSIVGFLECDIRCRMPPYKGMLYGERVNGNFALYSLHDDAYHLEIDSGKYGEVKGRGLRYCLDDGFVYLLCGGYVLVVDVERKLLVKEINYASDSSLEVLLKEGGYRSVAALISVRDGVIVLSSYNRPGWVAMIDTNTSDAFAWIVPRDEVTIVNTPGDLIYAMEGQYPVAIDKYNGELVWSAMRGTFANEIHVGTSWVVYSTVAGKLQCFKMKEESYLSPAHP